MPVLPLAQAVQYGTYGVRPVRLAQALERMEAQP